MADNFQGTDFSGAPVDLASDEIGGVHHPRLKAGFGADGEYSDVSPENPLPVASDELVQISILLSRIIDAVSALSPDVANRLRVNVESGTVTISSGTITTVTTVTTVATLTNQAQMGGIAANQQIPIMNLLGEGDLRRNFVFS